MSLFKKIYIEIGNICNLQCAFCPEVERPKKLMSAASFSKLLPEVIPLTEQVTLHLMGEPLAHPEFKEIAQITKNLKAKVNLTTNGILINRYKDELLFESFFQINFSIHSFIDNFPQKDFRPYLDDLVAFTKYAHKVRPDLYFNYRLWNLSNTKENQKQLQNQNREILSYLESKYENEINPNVDTALIKSKKISNRVYIHFDTQFIWPSLNHPPISCVGTCYGALTQIGIHADGTVVPCCLDKEAKIQLGHWPSQSLKEIITGPRATQISKGFLQGEVVEDLCQRCTFKARFDKKALRLNTRRSL